MITVLKFCIDNAPYCWPSVWGERGLSPPPCSCTRLIRVLPFSHQVAEQWRMSTGRWDKRTGRCLDCKQEYFRKEAMLEIDCLPAAPSTPGEFSDLLYSTTLGSSSTGSCLHPAVRMQILPSWTMRRTGPLLGWQSGRGLGHRGLQRECPASPTFTQAREK